jgi:hypothetical protein
LNGVTGKSGGLKFLWQAILCSFKVRRFAGATIRRCDDSPVRRFAGATIRRCDDSPVRRFAGATIRFVFSDRRFGKEKITGRSRLFSRED